MHRKTFTWEGINYHVPVPGGQRRLLHDVHGYVKPGTLTALMGASGAGKTTCLDVLAQRKNIGVITGDMLVDGRPLGGDFARGTAYAEQMDVHEGTATVREAMQFSARLRQPAHVPVEEKDAYVEEMIELLELQDYADALVFSLGVESRKRLTIGVELASKPELLLFLDECVQHLSLLCNSLTIYADLPPVSTVKAHGTWSASSRNSLLPARPFSARFTSPRRCSSRASTDFCFSSPVVKPSTSATSVRTPRFCVNTSPVTALSAPPTSTPPRYVPYPNNYGYDR